MPSASSRSASPLPAPSYSPAPAEGSTLERIEEDGPSPGFCSPLPQGWASSNAHLEKLQTSARRCAVSTGVAPDAEGIQRSLAEAADARNVATRTAETGDQTVESDEGRQMDIDDSLVVVDNGEGRAEIPSVPSHAFTEETGAVRSRSLSLSSLSSSFDFPCFEDSSPASGQTNVRATTSGNDFTPQESDEAPTHPPDCRSTLPSPPSQPLFLDNSDAESLPSLQTIPSEGESTSPDRLPVPDRLILLDSSDVEAQIARIAQPPSTPDYHNWPKTSNWTRQHADFISNVFSSEHADALAFLRQATALIERTPDVLDDLAMQENRLVDVDMVNEQDSVTDDDCLILANRISAIRGVLQDHDADPGVSPRHIPDITSVPVSLDGRRQRLFSSRALAQPPAYRYTIEILARHHLTWIELYTLLRAKIIALNRYLTDLFKRRGWTMTEVQLHHVAPVPPPYLKPFEYSALRLFKYTFERHGYFDVAREIDDFLRYRFRESHIVSHLLHSGLFEPMDLYLDGAKGATFITRRTVPSSHRASIESAWSFRNVDLFFQKKYRVTARKLAERERAARN
ncbi:hypothetical protein C8R47DRAFT_1084512 [Mycena vitilis]|nr:hypothetical protein C8R47DRAFT_1084829 [Mycena vitilis]KAJ6450140.1 hypothetical protein C8R47DRAFT_1084512 [Mycena vitilis]